jgi:hypothetical protein
MAHHRNARPGKRKIKWSRIRATNDRSICLQKNIRPPWKPDSSLWSLEVVTVGVVIMGNLFQEFNQKVHVDFGAFFT